MLSVRKSSFLTPRQPLREEAQPVGVLSKRGEKMKKTKESVGIVERHLLCNIEGKGEEGRGRKGREE